MQWELDFIKFLQRGSCGFLDYLMYGITQMGTEIFFIVVAMVLYWCISKREGFKLVNLFMVSQVFVGVIKYAVKRQRPYLGGANAIMERTSGYSFPSGHSNNMAVTGMHCTLIARKKKNFKAVLIISICAAVLVMFSRMYLGQHYLTDVLTGAFVGAGVALAGSFLFDLLKGKEERLMFIVVPLCIIVFAAIVVAYKVYGESFDTLMNVAGTYSAITIGYYLEKRFVHYDIKADKKWKYFLRVLLGAAVLLAIKEGLKAIFNLFAFDVWSLVLSGFVRYFIIGIWVTLLAPMLFKAIRC